MSMNGMDQPERHTASAAELPPGLAEPVLFEEEEKAASPFALTEIPPRVPLPAPKGVPLLDGRDVPARFRQAFRELKFVVEQAREKNGVRTIGICSVEGGDARSVAATNLAYALVEGGTKRVALLDASFGQPHVARLLAAEAESGLADVLAGRVPPEQAMFAAGPDGLFGMATGDAEAAGIDPIDATERFGTLANRLATVFDFVLVDTPPLGERIDAAAICSRLDAVILVVRAGRTTAGDVDRAIAKLGASRLLGLVLDGV